MLQFYGQRIVGPANTSNHYYSDVAKKHEFITPVVSSRRSSWTIRRPKKHQETTRQLSLLHPIHINKGKRIKT